MIQRLVDDLSVECCYVTYIISLILSQHRKYSLMCRSSCFNSFINLKKYIFYVFIVLYRVSGKLLQDKTCVQSNLVSQRLIIILFYV